MNPFEPGTDEHDAWENAADPEPNPDLHFAEDDGRPQIVTGTAPETIRVLTKEISRGTLPDTYVTNGELVALAKVSGDVDTGLHPDGPPLPVASRAVTVDGLASLLAHHTRTTKRAKVDGEYRDVETTPQARVLSSVLERTYWPGVRPLYGIVGSPVLRPGGSLLQSAGYDGQTGLYLAPRFTVPKVPVKPSAAEVATSLHFLTKEILSGFPWVSASDKANFVALLITQILRPYLRSVTPFGMITATTPSSGKTLLSMLIGLLYGVVTPTWGNEDGELRKVITTMLSTDAQVVVWDNLKEGAVIDSPVLAQLLTSPVWSDRILGGNKTMTAHNARLWMATGNNLRLGGDMATRTVMVRLDPKMSRPELRTDFEIPNLDVWIGEPTNRVVLLRHLLILVADWIAAGAPRSQHVMRQFTTWAAAVGGFCTHHGIDGFLDNADEVLGLDDEDQEWSSFLATWDKVIGGRAVTGKELLATVTHEEDDGWDGRFITGKDGKIPNSRSLGQMLGGQAGRPRGGLVLRGETCPTRKQNVWRVEAIS